MTQITGPLSTIKRRYITKRNQNNIDVFDISLLKRNGYDYGSSATCRMRSPHPLQRQSAICREETLLPGNRRGRHYGLAIGSSRAARDRWKLTL
jgi:hypothetical protein